MVDTLAQLLAKARKVGAPVVHVQNKGQPGRLLDIEGRGGAIIDAVKPIPGESIVTKVWPNAFTDSELDSTLKRLTRRQLVIAGFIMHMSVRSTAGAALDLGYKVTVVTSTKFPRTERSRASSCSRFSGSLMPCAFMSVDPRPLHLKIGRDVIFYDFYINARHGAAAAAGARQGYSSLPDSSGRSDAQSVRQGDCSGSSACLAAGLAGLANPHPPRGRVVWQSCAWRAALGGSDPLFGNDSARGNSTGTQSCQIQETAHGIGGCIWSTASKAAGHQSRFEFRCSAPRQSPCHC